MSVGVLLIGAAMAAAASALSWRMAARIFVAPVLQRVNHRGVELPVATGAVAILAVLVIAAVAHLAALIAHRPADFPADWSTALASLDAGVLVALGFGALGLLDDLVGDADRRGFRGHVGAVVRGELTTGFVKLAGGVALGVVVAAGQAGGALDALRGGLLVAAAANLGNLFDRAPGRVLKMAAVGLGIVVACGTSAALVSGPVVVVAAGLGLLGVDLSERGMLGDTGANVLGAAVGLGLLGALGATGEWIALGAVAALNLVSERVSFSRVIDRTPPLRWLDRLGRG